MGLFEESILNRPKKETKEVSEESVKSEEKKTMNDLKLESEDVPEEFRGKTVEEILIEAKKAKEYEKALTLLSSYAEKMQQQTTTKEDVTETQKTWETIREGIGEDTANALFRQWETRMAPLAVQVVGKQVADEIEKVSIQHVQKYGEEVVGDIVQETRENLIRVIQANPQNSLSILSQPGAIANKFRAVLGQRQDQILERYVKKLRSKEEGETVSEEVVSEGRKTSTLLSSGLPTSISSSMGRKKLTEEEKRVYHAFEAVFPGLNIDELKSEFDEGPVYADAYAEAKRAGRKKT